MRKYLFFSIICAFLFAVTGCQKDACAKVTCGDYGTCVNGECNCLVSYEKDAAGRCTVEQRQKFIGSWGGSVIIFRDSSGILDTTMKAVAFDIVKAKRSLNEIDIFGYPVACLGAVDSLKATVKSSAIMNIEARYCSGTSGQNGIGFTDLNWYLNGSEMKMDLMVITTDPNKPIGGVIKEHYVGNANKQ